LTMTAYVIFDVEIHNPECYQSLKSLLVLITRIPRMN
jgi:hypothetical protein